jgi:hypothetical protein
MTRQTSGANTATWLEASKDIKIRAYVESYTPTLTIQEQIYPSPDFCEDLWEISIPLSEERAGAIEPELALELEAWDILSDEALRNFENQLD